MSPEEGSSGPQAAEGHKRSLTADFSGQVGLRVLELGSVHGQNVWSLLNLEDVAGRKLAGASLDDRLRSRRSGNGVHLHHLAHGGPGSCGWYWVQAA